jgi:small subunit ribosomal protein S20
MPNTKAAKKAMRVSIRRKAINESRRWKVKNSLKELRKCLATNPTAYQATLSKVFSGLDKAVKSNLIHRNKANRKKSRLSKMVAKVNAPIAETV